MLAEVVIGMTTEEARYCVEEIKAHVGKARARLLDLYQRQGWLSLGYGSWRECVECEFGQSQRYLYYQLQAAITEQNLCTIVQNHDPIPESHLRPLSLLSPEKQVDAWQRAVETAPDGKITAAHVQSVVDGITNRPHVSFNTGENEWYTSNSQYGFGAQKIYAN